MIDNQQPGAVLVTGGGGFVGSYVVRALLERGERVVVYDVVPRGDALLAILSTEPELLSERLTFEPGSVAEPWRLLRACARYGVDRIVHLASPLTLDVSANPLDGIRQICEGTANVFETALARSVRRVVWASSVAVFGRRADYPPGPVANDAPHRPLSIYGSCKSLCETMAAQYRAQSGLDSIGLRLTVVYGPSRTRGYMSFPSELIRRAARGATIDVPIADYPANFQYVEDVAELMLGCLDAPTPTDTVFNTSGDVRTFREAGAILQQSTSTDLEVSFTAQPTDEAQQALLDVPFEYDAAELSRQIGYTGPWSLERGIEHSLTTISNYPVRVEA